MIVEQLYTGCLAQAAYYIESDGQAAVIDPLRESFPYIERAAESGAKITHVFETHFHADFVSGHVDLAEKTNAKLVYGPGAQTGYEAYTAEDGERFEIGNVSIEVLHTPGHTLESTTYLLRDEQGKPHCIFTGDTLFIGDVGRPDLAQKAGKITEQDLAGMLYDSLRNKIMPLPDDVIVYPAHGAGSACGKKMSDETSATLGDQKQFNYALRADMSKEEFIQEVTEGLMPPPAYFPENVRLNKEGYDAFEEVMERGLEPLSPEAFAERQKAIEAEDAEHPGIVLDTRSMEAFAEGHIPGSVFIGLDGNFAPWVGALVPSLATPILVVAEEGREEEAVRRLSRVGYDNARGFLKGGVAAWKASGRPLSNVPEQTPEVLAKAGPGEDALMLDVRKPSEYEAGHFEGTRNVPLDYLESRLEGLDPQAPYLLHCQGGYRSLVAWSLLTRLGFTNMVNVPGGFEAMEEAGMQVLQPA
jgi:glyoxylase-like metal-dependent hydrolase (beta-lactamase superfamily II)/rhodanese-related sulfurtransferase